MFTYEEGVYYNHTGWEVRSKPPCYAVALALAL
jgi:hypothetical protein